MALFKDPLAQKTFQKGVVSTTTAGINFLSDFTENSPIGTVPGIGTPYFDSVKFLLSDTLYIGEYINTTISISNNTKISKSTINGRRGDVKQLISQGDYNITFNIDIFSEFKTEYHEQKDSVKIRKVGQTGQRRATIGDYYPSEELQFINNFFNAFYNDDTYSTVFVESGYLLNFGIDKIIPYSIQTRQDHSVTNRYSIVIQAYSDIDDKVDGRVKEIIPTIK